MGRLERALGSADIAAILLRLAPGDERTQINSVKALAPHVQDRDIALVLDGLPHIAAKAGADGAHLTGIDALTAEIGALQPARIAGVGGVFTRHDAMLAGEAGVDYIMFGEPDAAGTYPPFAATLERLAWWAEVFQPPCVGYAASIDEVGPILATGADFVAAGDFIWADDAKTHDIVRAIATQIATPEAVP